MTAKTRERFVSQISQTEPFNRLCIQKDPLSANLRTRSPDLGFVACSPLAPQPLVDAKNPVFNPAFKAVLHIAEMPRSLWIRNSW